MKDGNSQQLAYVYYEGEPGRQSAAKLLTKDEMPTPSQIAQTILPTLLLRLREPAHDEIAQRRGQAA